MYVTYSRNEATLQTNKLSRKNHTMPLNVDLLLKLIKQCSLSLARSVARSVCNAYRMWTVEQFALRLNKLNCWTDSYSVCIESQTFCYLNLTMFMCVLAKYTIFTMIWYSDECN